MENNEWKRQLSYRRTIGPERNEMSMDTQKFMDDIRRQNIYNEILADVRNIRLR